MKPSEIHALSSFITSMYVVEGGFQLSDLRIHYFVQHMLFRLEGSMKVKLYGTLFSRVVLN